MRTLFAVLALAAATPTVRAEIKPHPLVSDGMVLQRGVGCTIWGSATEEEKVTWKLTQPNKDLEGTALADKGHWTIHLPVIKEAGGPFTLTLKGKNTVTIKDVYVGEVWLASGQSNMEWTMTQIAGPQRARKETEADDDIKNSKNPHVRMFTVTKVTSYSPRDSVIGRWSEAGPMTTGGFSAVAYYFARELSAKQKVPIGIIASSWGGTVAEAWVSKNKLDSIESLKYLSANHSQGKKVYESAFDVYLKQLEEFLPVAKKARQEGKDLPPLPLPPFPPNPNTPTVLHNAMIRPLQPYAIKGVIWYQGESNAGRAHEYQTLFPALIENWREEWKNPDMPFLFVQLAPWQSIVKEPTESAWAELCEAQRLTSLKVKNTAMAVINDVGDPADIHPRKKKPVGQRLALAARALAYGEKVEYTGPVYDAVDFKDGKATVTFKNTGGGLEAKGGELTGFTIAGKDRRWHNAKAEIKDSKVVVWSDDVSEPVAVRFGWANCPVVNLFSKDGLPASAFRTDDFPLVTAPKKK
jgi:sialate O-acetylesterase